MNKIIVTILLIFLVSCGESYECVKVPDSECTMEICANESGNTGYYLVNGKKFKFKNENEIISKLIEASAVCTEESESTGIFSRITNFVKGIFSSSDSREKRDADTSQKSVNEHQNKKSAKTKPEKIKDLQWSNQAKKIMNLENAIEYCEKLSEDGHSDWRLPNIDELRTLIQNSSTIQTGGSCEISEKAGKLAYSDMNVSSCWGKNGSNFSKLGDDTILWSSSICSDDPMLAWIVNFIYGRINAIPKSIKSNVRCVREESESTGFFSRIINFVKGVFSSSDSKEKMDADTSQEPVQNTRIKNQTDKQKEKSNTSKSAVPTNKNESTETENLQWSKRATKSLNWNDAIDYCKNLNEGGHSDWKLPNIDELRSLIQNHSGTQTGGTCKISEKAGKLSLYDKNDDCIGRNGSNFSKLGDTDWFWSSTTLSDSTKYAWGVIFSLGEVRNSYKGVDNFVRCVRNGNDHTDKQNEASNTDISESANPNNENESTETEHLQWSQKTSEKMNWNQAIDYCKNLHEANYNDWHLPTISELRSLIQNCPATQSRGECKVTDNCLSYDECRKNGCSGCIRDSSGKYSKLGDNVWLWSSSVRSDDSDLVWGVHFYAGNVYSYDKDNNNHVRCVRDENNQGGSPNETEEKASESVESTKMKCNFSIQLSASHSKDEAMEEAERYKPLETRIIEAVVNDTTWYRLRTGCFDSREEADEALPEIKKVVENAMVMPESLPATNSESKKAPDQETENDNSKIEKSDETASVEDKADADAVAVKGRAEKAVVGKVSVGKIEVDGAVDSASVARTIRGGSTALKRCYDKALLANPTLEGKVSVTILINEKGRVESIGIAEDTLKDAETIKCIKGVISRLRFPKPEDSSAKITLPVEYGLQFGEFDSTEDVNEALPEIKNAVEDAKVMPESLPANSENSGKNDHSDISVSTGRAVITGALDSSVIDTYIGKNLSKIRLCYEQGLNKDPQLFGRIVINFIISETGDVSSSKVQRTTMGNETVESCVADQIKNISFPAPKGGDIVIVNYPFVFKTAE